MVKQSLQDMIKNFPLTCGVYLMKDHKNCVIYVGKAKNLRSRVKSYFSNLKDNLKHNFLTPKICHIDYILTATEAEAFLLEANLIKKYTPRYNVRLKDDKSYPYIRCSVEEDFPRFSVERKVKKKGSVYFGPYTDSKVVKWMIRFLNQHFQIRDCSNHFMKGRKRPCLTYQLGACSAPCVKYVSQMQYRKQIEKALLLLKKGRLPDQVKTMEQQMKQLADRECFEQANRLKNFIKSLQWICSRQSVVINQPINQDIAVFYEEKKRVLFYILHVRAGAVIGQHVYFFNPISRNQVFILESFFSFLVQYYVDHLLPEILLLPDFKLTHRKSLTALKNFFKKQKKNVRIRFAVSRLEKQLVTMAVRNAQSHFEKKFSQSQQLAEGLHCIQKIFHLSAYPQRMECFDISHFQGESIVAGQSVFEAGEPAKNKYRKYKIAHGQSIANDTLALKTVILRRFKLKNKKEDDPDVIIVDGGKGQLHAVQSALQSIRCVHIPIIAIAKGRVKSDFLSPIITQSPEKFFITGRKNPILLSSKHTSMQTATALRILTHIRDEAHRFAISYHRYLRQKH